MSAINWLPIREKARGWPVCSVRATSAKLVAIAWIVCHSVLDCDMNIIDEIVTIKLKYQKYL